RVAGRWRGRVGGVLVKPLPKVIDLMLEGLQPLLVLPDEGQDRRLGSRRYLAPIRGDRFTFRDGATLAARRGSGAPLKSQPQEGDCGVDAPPSRTMNLHRRPAR